MNNRFLGYPPDFVKRWLERVMPPPSSKQPFCIEALTNGNVKLLQSSDTIPSFLLVSSLDNKNWSDWDNVIGTDLAAG